MRAKSMTLGLFIENLNLVAKEVGRDTQVVGAMVDQKFEDQDETEFPLITLQEAVEPMVLLIPTNTCPHCGEEHH